MKQMTLQEQLDKMRRDWDARALKNSRYYVETSRADWSDEDFRESGRIECREQILNDMTNVCQGMDPKQMRVLEIGCGAGRIVSALAEIFGEVHGVDVSGEMIRNAHATIRHLPNARVYQNNGMDLAVLPAGLTFDFAFSTIVFQHIPSYEVIENYVREVHRVLRPGGLFKLQVQGQSDLDAVSLDDTWRGVPFTERQAFAMAERCGFEARHAWGRGDQYFWLWFFKKPE